MIHRAVTISLLFFAISPAMIATPPGYASRTEKVKTGFARLKANPNDPAVQALYIKAFPRDYQEFLALFGSGGSLADGYECDYIFAISSLQAGHSAQVGRLLVQLSKDAEDHQRAPSCFQHVVATYGSQYTRPFAAFIHKLSPREREQLINFLADADVVTYPHYQRIIRNLQQLNQGELAKQFQQAHAARSHK
ncbi:MAG TPA: hypothetical protein VFT65_09755 [Candidatus Angelobacter sp.]|nr:hypothetical protein [Candidatus Angelobacter sp.]